MGHTPVSASRQTVVDLGQSWLEAWSSAEDLALMSGARAARHPGLHLVDLQRGPRAGWTCAAFTHAISDLIQIASHTRRLPSGCSALMELRALG